MRPLPHCVHRFFTFIFSYASPWELVRTLYSTSCSAWWRMLAGRDVMESQVNQIISHKKKGLGVSVNVCCWIKIVAEILLRPHADWLDFSARHRSLPDYQSNAWQWLPILDLARWSNLWISEMHCCSSIYYQCNNQSLQRYLSFCSMESVQCNVPGG